MLGKEGEDGRDGIEPFAANPMLSKLLMKAALKFARDVAFHIRSGGEKDFDAAARLMTEAVNAILQVLAVADFNQAAVALGKVDHVSHCALTLGGDHE